ncbi:Uncharacterized protein TCM_038894 [Theobroma cacao]|uniref:Endonuclease/exonuclease/phosphatase domain-containing protein n=1 Tax=Theobroma cacao TaxID=3641 RepID=A0A061GQU3_THECC|nr:Uncharacterized protein TCM_038894 [Theobroma cacao]
MTRGDSQLTGVKQGGQISAGSQTRLDPKVSDVDKSKEQGGVEELSNFEKKRENKEGLKGNEGVGLNLGGGPYKIQRLNAEDKRKMIKEVRAKQGQGERKPHLSEAEGSLRDTVVKTQINIIVRPEARSMGKAQNILSNGFKECKSLTNNRSGDETDGVERNSINGITMFGGVGKSIKTETAKTRIRSPIHGEQSRGSQILPQDGKGKLMGRHVKKFRAGRGEKNRALRKLIRAEKPSMVFIQEIKMEKIIGSLFDKLWRGDKVERKAIEAEGRSGGILSLWQKKFFELEEYKTKKKFIMLIGRVKGIDYRCGFINIYDPNDEGKRKELWDELSELTSSMEVWWIIGGDFNTMRFEDGRIRMGNVSHLAAQFDEFINCTGLVDLPLTGPKYTWCNNWQLAAFSRKFEESLKDDIAPNGTIKSIKPRTSSNRNFEVKLRVSQFRDDSKW